MRTTKKVSTPGIENLQATHTIEIFACLRRCAIAIGISSSAVFVLELANHVVLTALCGAYGLDTCTREVSSVSVGAE
jgi:hypothetical protein